MKRNIVAILVFALCLICRAADNSVAIQSVEAQQRYPWNGLVDIVVTFSGESNGVAAAICHFSATNSAICTALSVTSVVENGYIVGSESLWTRRYVWDSREDVGDVKIDDVAFFVEARMESGVQLWEDGPYWAECNVGANKPEECGYYFWWGDTVGYKRNAENDGWVSVADGTAFSFTSANCPTYSKDGAALQSLGYIDSSGNLVAAHDAATVHWGAPWRMPTDAEISELISNCTTTWTNRNGVAGRLVTGKDAYAEKSIFIPAAGDADSSNFYSTGSFGYYWSSTPHSTYAINAWYLLFGSNKFRDYDGFRCDGRTIRPLRGLDSGSNVYVKCGSAGTNLRLDCRAGTRESLGDETLRYSNLWDGDTNATVTIAQNDVPLVFGLACEGDYAWSAITNGTYTLTHTTYTNSAVAKVLSATFAVTDKGVLIDPASIMVTPYEAQYDGAGHGISVVGPDGTTAKYCATPTGMYGDCPAHTDVCATQIWYEISGEGYIPYTNSASLKITPKTGVTVAIAGKTKTVVYNGEEQSVSGYDIVSISDQLYKTTDISFSGSAVAQGIDAEMYPMNLSSDQFANTNGNFSGVVFDVSDGWLLISAVEPPHVPRVLYESDTTTMDTTVASTWDGYLADDYGNLNGTINVSVAKLNEKKGFAKATIKVTLAGYKTFSFKAELRDGKLSMVGPDERELALEFNGTWMHGTYGEFFVDGSRNRYKAKDYSTKNEVASALETYGGAYGVVVTNGNISVVVGSKGKVKITGLIDAWKVNTTSTLILGDNCAVIPVVITETGKWQMISGHAKFYRRDTLLVFNLWIDKSAIMANYIDTMDLGRVGTQMGTEVVFGELPSGCTRFDSTALEALKLKLNTKNGVISGSMKLQYDDGAKQKKVSAKITGIEIGDTGWANGTIKNLGNFSLQIR